MFWGNAILELTARGGPRQGQPGGQRVAGGRSRAKGERPPEERVAQKAQTPAASQVRLWSLDILRGIAGGQPGGLPEGSRSSFQGKGGTTTGKRVSQAGAPRQGCQTQPIVVIYPDPRLQAERPLWHPCRGARPLLRRCPEVAAPKNPRRPPATVWQPSGLNDPECPFGLTDPECSFGLTDPGGPTPQPIPARCEPGRLAVRSSSASFL